MYLKHKDMNKCVWVKIWKGWMNSKSPQLTLSPPSSRKMPMFLTRDCPRLIVKQEIWFSRDGSLPGATFFASNITVGEAWVAATTRVLKH